MLIARKKVHSYLSDFLFLDDQKHLELITDLSWCATIVFECAFQCPKKTLAKKKEKLFALIEQISELKKTSKIAAKSDYSFFLNPAFSGKQVTIEDISIACDLFYKLSSENGIPKIKLLEWLKEEAVTLGAYQQRVYSMEVEGGILNAYGIVTNFGCNLAMWGVRKGLLPSE